MVLPDSEELRACLATIPAEGRRRPLRAAGCRIVGRAIETTAEPKGRSQDAISCFKLFTPGGNMALRLDEKKAMVAEVAAVAAGAQSVVAAQYRGLTATQMTDLRAKARKSGVYLRVVKNTLARKAIAGTPFECVGNQLKGPLILAFSKDDPGAAARLVKAFAKDNDKLVPTLVSLGDTTLEAKELDKVASLPTLESARATLLGALQAPIGKLVRTVAEPHAKLVRALAAVKDKLEAGA
jgi:large subunit ribosomal protein L10